MLKTLAKAKIGKHLSYPLGAETISEAIGDIPQAAQTAIYFLATPTEWASEFRRILRDCEPYPILKCHRNYVGGVPYAGISSNISWEIVVYPVARELKADAKNALMTCGLPELKDFLLKTAPSNRTRYPEDHIAFNFDPIEKRVTRRNR